jgi:hypothetical protein
MSSIVNRLTEGVVNRDMRAESHALLSKWKKTGLLEGIETERKQNTMARLLENQAKELLREQTTMGAGGSVEGFAAVAFPIVRRVFAGLIANDLVSVQPMSLPSGLIFFLDFVYSANIGADGTMVDRFGNTADQSIYGTDRVASQITGGVNIVGSLGENLSGPRDMVGYAYGSPETLLDVTASSITVGTNVAVASLTNAQKKQIDFDPDILAETSANLLELKVPESSFTNPDLDNLAAFDVSGSAVEALSSTSTGLTDANTKLIRRLSSTDGSSISLFFISEEANLLSFVKGGAFGTNLRIEHPAKDSAAASTDAAAGAIDTYTMLLEANANIPEIDIKVDSIAVTAQTKKLKAKWTPELGQDLNAYHNLDAEVELTSILSEQIALEIDREILADLVKGATAGTRYWSRAPGLFVDSSGAEIGALSAAPDFTGTVSEWYETLVETINDVSAQIHRKTLRGGANFVVCGPEVANILEFTAGFRASVTHDDEKGSIGALRVGSLSKKFDVIVDPYFMRNVLLVGRRGASFLESGYVYAPYVPLQTTPTIFGPEDFVPRKGVMTRYAKKMVRPDMYGLVVVRGLLGESGATS